VSDTPGSTGIRAWIPGLLCLAVLCATLLAGLLPFRAPRNGVAWLPNQNGLRLSGHSVLWSSGSFQSSETGPSSACSVELWLRPGATYNGDTIFSFASGENLPGITIYQYQSGLMVERRILARPKRAIFAVDGAFRQIRPIFFTITSGAQNSAIYVDALPARKIPRYGLGDACRGQIVVGTSPYDDDSWPGQILGIAVYRQALSPATVQRHYQTWTSAGRPELSIDDNTVALYLFDERAGYIVHNSVPGGIDLDIPRRYALVHQRFLRPFWKEYRPGWDYWKDILVNIAGLIPLGFFFCAYWTSVRPLKRAALLTTALGFAISLTIEISQAFIPTRDSGTTDLITNTLGTFLGTRLYDWKVAKALFARLVAP
jgi:VanZ family protein